MRYLFAIACFAQSPGSRNVSVVSGGSYASDADHRLMVWTLDHLGFTPSLRWDEVKLDISTAFEKQVCRKPCSACLGRPVVVETLIHACRACRSVKARQAFWLDRSRMEPR